MRGLSAYRALLAVGLCVALFANEVNAASCSRAMLTGNRWSDITCVDRTGDGVPETVAWYNHRAGLISEVTFSSNGVQLSKRLLSRQARRPKAATLASVCPTRSGLAKSDVWKSRQSPHIPSFDSRKNSTALIILRGGRSFPGSCMSAYSKTGKLVHKLGAYYPTGYLYNKRLYGGWGCGDKKTPNQVKTASGGNGIYLKVASNKCILVPNPRVCYNSVGC